MGHNLLGILPTTQKFQHVVALLAGEADVDDIAAASSDAAEASLRRAADEPGFREAFWLLTQLPLAARKENFAAELRRLRLQIDDRPSLVELVSAFGDAVDRHIRDVSGARRTDFGEMARAAATEAITVVVGRDLPGLFGPSPDDVQLAVGKYTSPNNFTVLVRDFLSRLTYRHLDYYLSVRPAS